MFCSSFIPCFFIFCTWRKITSYFLSSIFIFYTGYRQVRQRLTSTGTVAHAAAPWPLKPPPAGGNPSALPRDISLKVFHSIVECGLAYIASAPVLGRQAARSTAGRLDAATRRRATSLRGAHAPSRPLKNEFPFPAL